MADVAGVVIAAVAGAFVADAHAVIALGLVLASLLIVLFIDLLLNCFDSILF